ncbi:MAG: hypothetical protein NWE92_00480 [Candidatus Bathyarchaeota archaeon]|nr:hypothetical protein [Candidatus Bathyarchaeota archaeon]
MRKSLMLLLVLTLAGSIFTPVSADPFFIGVPAPNNVDLIIEIQSPIEGKIYPRDTINLCFNVTVGTPDSVLMDLKASAYKGDWMNQTRYCLANQSIAPRVLQFNLELSEIPDGWHTLNITGRADGYYTNKTSDYPRYVFTYNKTVSINFAVGSGSTTYVPSPTTDVPTTPEFSSSSSIVLLALITLAVALAGVKVLKEKEHKHSCNSLFTSS